MDLHKLISLRARKWKIKIMKILENQLEKRKNQCNHQDLEKVINRPISIKRFWNSSQVLVLYIHNILLNKNKYFFILNNK